MASTPLSETGPRHLVPLIIVGIALVIRFVPGWVVPYTPVHFWGLGLGPVIGMLGLLLWWVFARGLPRHDRWLGLLYALALLVAGFMLGHRSMPQFQVLYGFVAIQAAFAAALYLTRARLWPERRWLLALAVAIGWLPLLALRQDGQIGVLTPEIALRWAPTAEDVFLESRAAESSPTAVVAEPLEVTSADWPGFRGPLRDGQVRGVSFATDWEASPPRELWRRRVGPGWSSFAVAGDWIFTQEQRGEDEVVACYSLADGSEIWVQTEKARFEEPAAGAGPRATPTFDGGTLFALGARGSLQALDAATGDRLWRRDLMEDVDAPLPYWGFSSSPLVTGSSVLVFAGGPGNRAVVAYERDTGELLWSAGHGALSYGSAHLATIDGVEQVLMVSDRGLEAFAPATGEVLWEFESPLPQMARIVQPALLEDGRSLIIANGPGVEAQRLRLTHDAGGGWSVEEIWSSRFLKPYFNDLACHEGTCYGFDGKILTAIGVDDGQRRWKGGRYGHGQLVLVPDMDLLLVITETGEVVLVEATPEAHREVARFRALDGKTWNHPVITQGKLLVRNAEEAACFELPA